MTAPASLTIASSIAVRMRYLAGRVHSLGPKPLFEMLCTIAADSSAALDLIERYAALPAGFIEANNGRDFPPHLWLIKE